MRPRVTFEPQFKSVSEFQSESDVPKLNNYLDSQTAAQQSVLDPPRRFWLFPKFPKSGAKSAGSFIPPPQAPDLGSLPDRGRKSPKAKRNS
jgi:hypothetical protein